MTPGYNLFKQYWEHYDTMINNPFAEYGYMVFRGVRLIRPITVDLPGTSRMELLFDNILDHPTRDRWAQAGYPVYFDSIASKHYIIVDRNTKFDQTEFVEPRCECGALAVKASKHSTWCGAYSD